MKRTLHIYKFKNYVKKHKVEWKNQTFTSFVYQLKKQFYESKNIRHTFTKEERTSFFNDQSNCESCKKKLTMKGFHIDHIVPLACGGTNEKINLQILCQPCHFEKQRMNKKMVMLKFLIQ